MRHIGMTAHSISARRSRGTTKQATLPETNTKFILQAVFLAFSLIFLLSDAKSFTFFAILMFAAPILIDLCCCCTNSKLGRVLRVIYLVLNAAIVFMCVLGLCGALIDSGDAFSTLATSMILPGRSFSKKHLILPLLLEVGVPITLHVCSPSIVQNELIDELEARQGIK